MCPSFTLYFISEVCIKLPLNQGVGEENQVGKKSGEGKGRGKKVREGMMEEREGNGRRRENGRVGKEIIS